ncbi:MAG: sodium:solute symporter family protein [Acidobacteria bacterium]|nr:MAG: sodium:solute symporter family protein [Acidobacteriota bacterium]
MNMYLVVVIVYLLFLTGVGLYKSRIVKTEADFMVAGRKLGAPILVGTLLATWIGSGSIIAGAGLAYREGFAALWFDAGVWIAIIIIYFVAGRARRLEQMTVPDVLELRYNQWARILGTIVTIIAYTVIASYQFRAGGLVLNVVTGLDEDTGILLTAIFVILFTAIAGLVSVAFTDIFNGTLMLSAIFIAYPFLIDRAGGWSGVRARLQEHFGAMVADQRLSLMGRFTWDEALSYALPTMLLMLGLANMYQRFFSARDERAAKQAVIGWISGTVVIESMIVVLAVIGSALFPELASQEKTEQVLLYTAREGLPLVIGCILLAAAVAIIVSTADSFLLVPATNVIRDLYQRFINPDVSQRRIVLYSRLAVVGLGVVAYGLVYASETVLEAALQAYTIYGVGITPALLACFFWKRATSAGAIGSIGMGAAVTLFWEYIVKKTTWLGLAHLPWIWGDKPWREVATIYPALFASLLCLFILSWLTAPPPEAKWRPFFQRA